MTTSNHDEPCVGAIPPSPINIAEFWRLFSVVLNLEETSLSRLLQDGQSGC